MSSLAISGLDLDVLPVVHAHTGGTSPRATDALVASDDAAVLQ